MLEIAVGSIALTIYIGAFVAWIYIGRWVSGRVTGDRDHLLAILFTIFPAFIFVAWIVGKIILS